MSKALRNYRDFDIGWASYTEYSFAQLEYSTNPAVITDTEKTFFATGFDDKRDSDGTGTGSTLYLALQLFNENGYLNSDGVSSTFWGTLSHELSHMIDAERGVSVAAPEENSRSAEDAAVSFQDIITLEIEEYFNNKGLNVKIPLRNSYDNLVTEGVQALDKKTKKWLDKKKKG